ncbi:MAG: FAD:protein FMN transferase [Nitrococcus sp.]|nr:FAD:protein FMN transferase [Nitrococcus sp.]
MTITNWRWTLTLGMMRGLSLPTVLLAVLLAVTGCQSLQRSHSATASGSHSATFFVFGTLVDVTLRGVSEARAENAFAALQEDFRRMHRDWHPWQPGPLTRLNTGLAKGECTPAPESIRTLIRRSTAYERATGGLFNPAIGKLIELWGFHTSQFPIEGPPPSAAAIKKLVAQQPSMTNLELRAGCVASSNPAVWLDFSGIAKGYAVDLAVERMRDTGVPAALVSAGGDLRAYSGEQSNWRVGIRDPAGGVLAILLIRGDRAVSTSGVDQRYREDAEKRYPHIIDPRTGYPVDHVASVTVVAQQGIQTDPAATALVVAGPGEWPAVAAALGMQEVLMVLPDGSLEMTPAMAKRLQDGPWQDRSTRIVDLPKTSPGGD